MKTRYEVIGLRLEQYVGQSVSGHNCDFNYDLENKERYIILLKNGNEKFELSLYSTEGECGSGWCSASWGYLELQPVLSFAGKTHKIKQRTFIDFDKNAEEINTEVFSISYDGGDKWYPSGFVSVEMDLFEETIRAPFEKRPVIIFKGDSNSLKSYLAALSGKEVFETDALESIENIPVITADIIVIGNKYELDVEKIRPFIFGEYTLIIADFYRES